MTTEERRDLREEWGRFVANFLMGPRLLLEDGFYRSSSQPPWSVGTMIGDVFSSLQSEDLRVQLSKEIAIVAS
jgi:hypothetical protein